MAEENPGAMDRQTAAILALAITIEQRDYDERDHDRAIGAVTRRYAAAMNLATGGGLGDEE